MIPGSTEVLNNENNNPLISDDKKKDFQVDKLYTPEDKEYCNYLQQRLQRAKNQRNQPYPEFDGKTYSQDYDENIKVANTKLAPKKNEDDVIVSAGTVEAKLDALLSHVNNLDLGPEVMSFDRENNRIQ